jgi:hypothetical protein
MTDIDPGELVRRYVAVWCEPDAGLRRQAAHDLFACPGPWPALSFRLWEMRSSLTTSPAGWLACLACWP